MSPALVLTTVNAPYSKKLDAQQLACCLLDPSAAKAAPGHMSSFFWRSQSGFAGRLCGYVQYLRAAACGRGEGFCHVFGRVLSARRASDPKTLSHWARLFRIACSLIRQVNSGQSIIDYWTFGGGTAMMLQIDHRESHDIDIFLPDPKLLPFLDPQRRDFKFEIRPTDYEGDGAGFLKLAFADIGEIDFIVGRSMTSSPTTQQLIEGETVELETIAEIVAKKIYYRRSSIRPRDIFDIAAAAESHAGAIIEELRSYRAEVAEALATNEQIEPRVRERRDCRSGNQARIQVDRRNSNRANKENSKRCVSQRSREASFGSRLRTPESGWKVRIGGDLGPKDLGPVDQI
jgi:hypothetical protein